MGDPLGRIEQQLMAASRRRAARLRARHRLVVAAAMAAGLLAAASVASAVTGVGPAGSIFADDDFAPPSAKPQPGGARTLLTAGSGAERFEVLTYQTRRSLTRRTGLKDYCVAIATPRADRDAHLPGRRRLASLSCEYAPTYAAKILRRGLLLGEAGPSGRPERLPVYGVTLATARSVSAKLGDDGPVQAELSQAFTIEIPRVPQRTRVQIESPSQQRATRGLPRSIRVRAFLALPASQPAPAVLTVSARFDGGRLRIARQRLRPPPPALPAPDLGPPRGAPRIRLRAIGAGGARWRMVAYRNRDGGTCIAAARVGRDPMRGRGAACAGGVGEMLSRRALYANAPDRVPSPGSYPAYGIVHGDARALFVRDPAGRRRRARLSRVLALRDGSRVFRVRAFLAVIPAPPSPGSGDGLGYRVVLASRRVVDDHFRCRHDPKIPDSLPPRRGR